MEKPLKVLVVEDSEADAALLLREMQRHGYKPTYERVETREDMLAALDRESWDLVIADYTLPLFSAPEALAVMKERNLDLPFIISTGSVRETAAVEAMKAGADDYVLKNNLERLFPAIERELSTAASRRGRRHAEQGLAQMAAIIESTDDAVISKTLDGIITSWNPAAERLYGYRAAEALGQPVSMLVLRDRSDELPFLLGKIKRGERVSQFETVRLRKDGQQVRVALTISPIKDATGKIIGASTIARDNTERKRAEERMAHLASFPEQNPSPIIETDRDWNITYANPAAGALFPDLGAHKLEHPALRGLDAVTRELDESPNKTVLREVHVGDRFYEQAIYLVREGKGLRMFTTDITDKKRLVDQMHRTQKMEAIEQLAGGIAHHFNNLMAGVKGFSELILRELKPDDTFHSFAEKIRNSADRAAILTRQLLNFSRNAPRQPALLDLSVVVTGMEPTVHSLAGDTVKVVLNCSLDLGQVKADPVQIEQLIVNLVTNARDAMPQGGTLTIGTANEDLAESFHQDHPEIAAGSYVMLAIRDTGTGMSDEAKAHLFEPFYTTKELNKGTGLGLPTCYAIARQNGGRIMVQSEAGRGTSVQLYLPRIDAKSTASIATPTENAGSQTLPGGNETVLLVDDEEDLREIASITLQDAGYRVLQAANGEEALKVIKQAGKGSIDLLLTDGRMPRMGGKQLAEHFRARYPNSKVLYISGYPESELRKQTSEPNSWVLPKPFTLSELACKVRQILDQTH